jgi:hypothetical protein
MKKKIWTTAIIAGILLLGMIPAVNAGELSTKESGVFDSIQCNEYQYQLSDAITDASDPSPSLGLQSDVAPGALRARFRGIWGDLDDNETKGYTRGIIGKRGRAGFLRGVYNTTDGNGSFGRVYGILKYGYFNGKVITPNGNKIPITGFYRVNREKHVLHLQWMTPNRVGWAHLRCNSMHISDVDSAD